CEKPSNHQMDPTPLASLARRLSAWLIWTVKHTDVKPFIRITRHPYEEPYHVNLVVAASNGRQQGELEIYANAEDLAVFARELRGFPRQQGHVARWELGSER